MAHKKKYQVTIGAVNMSKTRGESYGVPGFPYFRLYTAPNIFVEFKGHADFNGLKEFLDSNKLGPKKWNFEGKLYKIYKYLR